MWRGCVSPYTNSTHKVMCDSIFYINSRGGRPSGDKSMDFQHFFRFFPNFPGFSRILRFHWAHVNQLAESFNLICNMNFSGISGFSGFSGSGSGNPDLLLSRIDPGVKTDPMVPHMWLKPCWSTRINPALAKCNRFLWNQIASCG